LKRKERKTYSKRNPEEKLKRIQNLPKKQCCSRCKRTQKQEEFGYTSVGKAFKTCNNCRQRAENKGYNLTQYRIELQVRKIIEEINQEIQNEIQNRININSEYIRMDVEMQKL
ncbi:10725_t:CDS:1, partial [Dentiscutata heterogama]